MTYFRLRYCHIKNNCYICVMEHITKKIETRLGLSADVWEGEDPTQYHVQIADLSITVWAWAGANGEWEFEAVADRNNGTPYRLSDEVADWLEDVFLAVLSGAPAEQRKAPEYEPPMSNSEYYRMTV